MWALVCSWLSYIQVRNIQGLTPDLVTLFSEVLEKVWVLVCSCSSCYFIRNIQGPTLFQIWQLSHTFWKGVSPCMFLLCIYKGQKYTRSHTFSEKVWVLVCLTIIREVVINYLSHILCNNSIVIQRWLTDEFLVVFVDWQQKINISYSFIRFCSGFERRTDECSVSFLLCRQLLEDKRESKSFEVM